MLRFRISINDGATSNNIIVNTNHIYVYASIYMSPDMVENWTFRILFHLMCISHQNTKTYIYQVVQCRLGDFAVTV